MEPKTPAGWYPDMSQPGLERYWDGTTWTPATRTAPPLPYPAREQIEHPTSVESYWSRSVPSASTPEVHQADSEDRRYRAADSNSGPRSTRRSVGAAPRGRRVIYWGNLLSIRLFVAAVVLGLVATLPIFYLAQWIAGPRAAGIAAQIVFFPAMALGVVGNLMSGKALYCPKCRKRLKGGAERCHHCGYFPPSYQS